MHANKREAIDEIARRRHRRRGRAQEHGHRRHAVRRGPPDPLTKIEFPESVISMSLEPKKCGRPRQAAARSSASMMREDPTFRAHDQRGDRRAGHLGDGRAAPRGARQPHPERPQVRGRRPASPRWPTSSACAQALETEARYIRQIGRPRPVRRDQRALRAASRPRTAASSSSTASRAARCRASTSRRSSDGLREGFAGGGRTGLSRSSTCARRSTTASAHEVDSSEMAFHAAGVLAFRQAAENNIDAARADHEDRGARARGVPGRASSAT